MRKGMTNRVVFLRYWGGWDKRKIAKNPKGRGKRGF